MTPTATDIQDKTEVFADELTSVIMKVASKMTKDEREDRLNKLNERLSSETGAKRV